MTGGGRDAVEVEALHTDRYLESLLGSGETEDADGAAPTADPAILATVRWLRSDVQRVHPSFRFEERLARRLADVAAAMQLPLAAGAEDRTAVLLPFPFRSGDDPAADDLDPETGGPLVPRPVLIGGALASAALSIAGAAYVAWRLGRGGDPLARAVRAAHLVRATGSGVLGASGGIAGPRGLGPRGLD